MTPANRRTAIALIHRREPFKASALTGKIINERYVVYSYATPIGVFFAGRWMLNEDRHSATTGHHRTLLQSAITDTENVISVSMGGRRGFDPQDLIDAALAV